MEVLVLALETAARQADRGPAAVSFAFAAGAMLALVVVELAPQTFRSGLPSLAFAGTLGGGLLMLALAAVLGV